MKEQNIYGLIKSLEANKQELEERLEARKNIYIKSLEKATAGQILSQYNYMEYIKMMEVAKELYELDAKLRTAYYATQLVESNEK